MGYALNARMLAADPLAVSPITAEVRLPNRDWLQFLDGDLTAQDWELIGRVEREEISVDGAMARASGTGLSSLRVLPLRASIPSRKETWRERTCQN